MIEVLTAVASCERASEWVAALPRHADLVVADAARGVGSLADLADLRGRDAAFERVVRGKPAAMGGGRTP